MTTTILRQSAAARRHGECSRWGARSKKIVITIDRKNPSLATSSIDELVLGDLEEPEPATVELPTREMKLGTLRRLDRTSEIVRPLQRLAPTLSAIAVFGGLMIAAVLLGSRRRSALRGLRWT